MKYFSDADGLIAWIDDQGVSNLPVLVKGELQGVIDGNTLRLIAIDGSVEEEYQLWGSLIALALAIEAQVPSIIAHDRPLHLDTAAAIAHQRIERFRLDWHKGFKENPNGYPLELEANNSGVYFEQMSAFVAEG